MNASNALRRFEEAFDELAAAKNFAKPRHQVDLFAAAGELLTSSGGLTALYERAACFDDAGVFHGGPWEEPSRLQPSLVSGCLLGEGQYPTIESLSELRLLAIAAKRAEHPNMPHEQAREFLREAIALNLGLLFGGSTESTRTKGSLAKRAHRLLRFIVDELGLEGLRSDVVEEIGFRVAQRPIVTTPVRELIRLAAQLPKEDTLEDRRAADRLRVYTRALDAPTPLSETSEGLRDYRERVKNADLDAIQRESDAFATSLHETGLGNPHHAILIRELARRDPDALPRALGIEGVALAELRANWTFAKQLIRVAILPTTADAILGLVGVLERGLLSRDEVAGGLRRLVNLDVKTRVRTMLRARYPRDSGITANSILVASALDVLGQPLGVGQGSAPTCQAARALSLWSMHAPGYLLEILATAVRDDVVEFRFEGEQLRSDALPVSPSDESVRASLDPVSAILVPHLDRLYGEMLRRAHGRGVDAHKWVNPAMYGRWVSTGFCTALDVSGTVTEHREMVRRFYATHHPEYSEGHALVYPNPVGIFVTDVHGNLLGPHAVSLLRIEAYEGSLRAYFFNPNDEGRQNWGQDIRPTVRAYAEEPGESSLPLHQFASRLYAFHYNPYEIGDAFAVPSELIDDVGRLARESWGRALPWVEPDA